MKTLSLTVTFAVSLFLFFQSPSLQARGLCRKISDVATRVNYSGDDSDSDIEIIEGSENASINVLQRQFEARLARILHRRWTPKYIQAFSHILENEEPHLTRKAKEQDRVIVNSLTSRTVAFQTPFLPLYFLPNGDVLSPLFKYSIAKGMHKEIFSLDGVRMNGDHPESVDYVLQTDLKSNDSWGLTREAPTFKALRERAKNGQSIEGLLDGYVVIDDNKGGIEDDYLVIQRRLDHTLKEYTKGFFVNRDKPGYSIWRRNLILTQIALGLKNLHEMSLVHGDLTDTNILLNLSKTQAFISDFGLTFNPTQEMFPRSSANCEAPEMPEQYALRSVRPDAVSRIQKRDLYGFGLLSVRFLPGYFPTSLYESCKELFSDYTGRGEKWGKYGECIKKEALTLHSLITSYASDYCTEGDPYCYENIVRDCLNPDPDLRPSAQNVWERLSHLNQKQGWVMLVSDPQL